MSRLRRDTHDSYFPSIRPLRIVASGTLFHTYTLSLPSYPAAGTVVRAHSVVKTRGGSASTLLSLLAQFPGVEARLVAPLGGDDEGRDVVRDLEKEGVDTRYCKVWKSSGVPTAWVLQSGENNTRTVVNHNPLPDITHEDFVSLLGPLLAPENYMFQPNASSPPLTTSPPRSPNGGPILLPNPNSPAPFEWLHFEGRSVKTTLSNITGVDGLARERKWRTHCVFSIDVGRRAKQGVEALLPFADVVFVNKHYAQAISPQYTTMPRSFLLSLTSMVPPHALLVYWSLEGGAVLSLPTKEYFQSSGWVEERATASAHRPDLESPVDIRSVRSGSDFWAGARSRTPSSSAFTAGDSNYAPTTEPGHHSRTSSEEDDNDSQGTEVPDTDDGVVDEVGAQDAFVAGMIYALSRRLCPGPPYAPFSTTEDMNNSVADNEKSRWRLDECLRFATELSGRKARRRNWDGLAAEMKRAGWLDN